MSALKNAPNGASKETGELHILDDIGPSWAGMVGAKWVAAELKAMGPGLKDINVLINSYGGDVFEGLTIYNLLKDHKANLSIHVAGVAASIASIIAMSGDQITMAAGSWMMIHNPWGITLGESSDMRRYADLLDGITDDLAKVYADRSGKEPGFFKDLMAKETWIDAETAVSYGLASEITSNKQAVVNSLSPRGYSLQNVPDELRSCATLAAKLNARINEIDRDETDDRTRQMVIGDLYSSASGTNAEGVRIEAILSGKEGCQTDAALELFAKTLGIPLGDLRAAHSEDGCRCKTEPEPKSKIDHKAQLAAWRAVGARIGK
ncbi:MAG TPA: head maturation protease, ClpP-related [Planctomicrobium sp.]|nr:head maturation protease, ClpP-related [Planctomicrobium sp.]